MLPERLMHASLRVRDYLLSRQSPNGVCAYRGYHLEEPNPADTWLGASSWRRLTNDTLPQRDEHADFVIDSKVATQPLPLYRRVCALQALDYPDRYAAQFAMLSQPWHYPYPTTMDLRFRRPCASSDTPSG